MENKKKADKPADEALHENEAQATFKGKINKYGFLHFGKGLMQAWNLIKGTEQPVTIELTPEGALIFRKT